jgi:NAD(P)H-quinone oxidoreductase subunit 5
MGFMMLQCGLGGFSAALLHIVAHSLYKAHAFLSSGSVLEQAARTQLTQARARGGRAVLVTDLLAVAGAVAILGLTLACFGIKITEKPGGIVLGFVLLLALTNLLSTFFATRVRNLSLLGRCMSWRWRVLWRFSSCKTSSRTFRIWAGCRSFTCMRTTAFISTFPSGG